LNPAARRPGSLRSVLLLGILLPVLAFIAINTLGLYRHALGAANIAYDRTLLASAKTLGEQLEVAGSQGDARLRATVPYSALEPFEADNRSRMFYRVSGFAGEMVSGFEDLPPWRGALPAKGPYAALVDFYDDRYHGEPVRVAVLLQPVAGQDGRGMATIQVAETLELRKTLARQILLDTLWRSARHSRCARSAPSWYNAARTT
jgi:two-component system sensor histidine kinase TctE